MNQRQKRRKHRGPNEHDLFIKSNILFFHIPKVAGASIRAALQTCYTAGHDTALLTFRKLNNEAVWNLKYKVAFVRNPWERAVSWFIFHADGPGPTKEYKNISFEEWIISGMKTHWGDRWYTKEQLSDPLSCLNYITDVGGKVMIDFIGRYEHLERDVQLIQKHCNIPLLPLPHIHKSEHTHYRDYYTNETRDIVAQRYKADIDFFNYEF